MFTKLPALIATLKAQVRGGAARGVRIQLRTYSMHLTPRKARRESAQKPRGAFPRNRRGFARVAHRRRVVVRVHLPPAFHVRVACMYIGADEVQRNKRRLRRAFLALTHRRR